MPGALAKPIPVQSPAPIWLFFKAHPPDRTHLEYRVRKDGVTQRYRVGRVAPPGSAGVPPALNRTEGGPATARADPRLLALLKQYAGDAEITPEEIQEAVRQYREVEARYRGTSQWLKAPNGQPTRLNERQWVLARTPNFKRWFGDWEGLAKWHALNEMSPVDAAYAPAMQPEIDAARAAARHAYRELQEATVKDGFGALTQDGRRIQFSMRGFKEAIHHAADRKVLAATAHLKPLFESAVPLYSEAPATVMQQVRAFHYYAVKAAFGNASQAFVLLEVIERDTGEFFYDADATRVEELRAATFASLADQPKAGAGGERAALNGRLAQWVGRVKQGPVSKVVDVNGEPLVVYHQTPAKPEGEAIKVFLPGGENKTLSGAAIWASPDPGRTNSAHNTLRGRAASSYREGVYDMPLFARIALPLNSAGSAWLQAYEKYPGASPWTLYPEDIVALRSAHDGVMHYADTGLAELAVFKPEQIKSAIGNTGTFRPDLGHLNKANGPLWLFFKAQRRAKAGGEVGVNGLWYEGGQWIANTELLPRPRSKQGPGTGKQQVEPYKWEAHPQGKRALYQVFSGLWVRKADGLFAVNPHANSAVFSAEHLEAAAKAAARYNAGERWV